MGKGMESMTYDESEAAMIAKEAIYLALLRVPLGESPSPDILAVMSSLYRAGWRDSYAAHMNRN